MSFRGRRGYNQWNGSRGRRGRNARFNPYPRNYDANEGNCFSQAPAMFQPQSSMFSPQGWSHNDGRMSGPYDYDAQWHSAFNNRAGPKFHGQEDVRPHQATFDHQTLERRHEIRQKPHRDDSSSSKSTCLYCEKRLRPDQHESHRLAEHWELEFYCGLCPPPPARPKHFAFLKQALDHLEKDHQTENVSEVSPSELKSRGLIRFPIDLRSLRCKLCPEKFILAQDRLSLSAHLLHSHEKILNRKLLRYNCRICQKSFTNSDHFQKHECCMIPEASPTESHAIKDSEEEIGEACRFCDQQVAASQRASHRGKHWIQEFQCAVDNCIRSFAFFDEIVKHLHEVHQISAADFKSDGSDVTGIDLFEKGWVHLPKDLRCLVCPFCDSDEGDRAASRKFFLSQDRMALVLHVKQEHQGQEMTKSSICYSCRCCKEKDFPSTKAFMDHPCVKRSTSSSEMDLLELSDLTWDAQTIPEGDLRRLVCRICRQQFNGQKFVNLIKHLEENHSKHQLSRKVNLENFVFFGCGHCPDFQNHCNSVRTWDHHFVTKDFKSCIKCSTDSKEDCNLYQADPNDIRRLSCKLCDFQSSGSLQSILNHLKAAHPKETQALAHLDSFIQFGCAKCPDFSPGASSTWRDHFYKCKTRCRVSYKQELEEKKKEEEREGAQVDGNDLRKLECKLCHFNATGLNFKEFCGHINSEHQMTDENDLESQIIFGCSNCPKFSPDSVVRWDRHFSENHRTCQGSGKVVRPDKKVLYWCDACQETREDINGHFSHESHKNICKAMANEKGVQLLRCDVCDVHVTTEANLSLHLQSRYHSEKQE